MEDKKQAFFNELVSLLRGHTVPCISNDARADALCEWAVIQLIKLFNTVNKLHIFPIDFKYSDYVYKNLEYPLKRLKENASNPWMRDKVIIGFMGHWATGKTTALNTLFEESFFTNFKGGTILNTYLAYGTNDKLVTIVDRAGLSQELSLDQYSFFNNLNSNCNFPFERVFNYIAKENSTKLLNKITILDTPGFCRFGSDITTKMLPCCDVIFWFVNITSVLTYHEIRVLKESSKGIPVYIIFTFVDAIGTTPDAVNNSIKSILVKLQKEGINYKGYLKLGRKDVQTQLQFKENAIRILTDISNEYIAYRPFNYISSSFDFLENHLANCQLCFINQSTNNTDISIDSQKSIKEFVFNFNSDETKMDLMLYNKISIILSKTKRIKDIYISLLNECESV